MLDDVDEHKIEIRFDQLPLSRKEAEIHVEELVDRGWSRDAIEIKQVDDE